MDDKALKENLGEKDVAIVLTPELASQVSQASMPKSMFALLSAKAMTSSGNLANQETHDAIGLYSITCVNKTTQR